MNKIKKVKNINKFILQQSFFHYQYNIEKINSLLTNVQSKLKNTKLNKQNKKKTYIKKKERDFRHFAPANKEWKNSIYTFNKNILLDMASKDKIASNYIKSYFKLVPTPLIITKSKRMRDLIRRSSTKQFFVAEPEIKQNNDNANITIYTFDREKKMFSRKLFFLRKWLSQTLNRKIFRLKRSKNKLITKIKRTNKIIKRNIVYKRHIFYYKRWWISKRKLLKKTLKKRPYYIKNDLFMRTTNILLRKKSYFINLFFYKFLKRIISTVFGKKVYVIKKNAKNKKNYVNIVNIGIRNKKKKVIKTKEGRIRHVKSVLFLVKVKSELNLKLIRSINIILFRWVMFKSKKRHIDRYIRMFEIFKHNYVKFIKQKHLKREVLIIKYLSNLYINNFKYYIYLPVIKKILSKIYNKKIKINIVRLKNIHLNSDIFSEAISIKLRKRTQSLLRILRKSFNFVRKIRPNNKYIILQKFKNLTTKEVKTYFGKYNVINGNVINKVFNKMFNHRNLTIIKGLLKSIKYKWVTGARIEAKGRLTKRYTASKALYKYKYRGTLRNLEHLKNKENNLESLGVSMLRGYLRPNTQQSLIHSKRRIGAFGIKGWISNS